MQFSYTDKIVLITGGTSGIGKASIQSAGWALPKKSRPRSFI
jgi:NADP-dependent 3-hydroxy acid dehydrogenase YdfG